MLAQEMPNARLLEANSLVELRLQPERLTSEIAAFLDEVWGTPAKRRSPRTAASSKRTASKHASAKRASSSGTVRLR
jgi:hypothetical protein